VLPSPHPAVVCKPVSEGAVLLHTESEVYFGLNRVGHEIWDLLPPACIDLTQVCEWLGKKYPEVARDDLERDVKDLLEILSKEGLVVSSA